MARYLFIWMTLTLTFPAIVLKDAYGQSFTLGKPAPEISGGLWLNSPPLTTNDLKGRVVLVEFWTYG